MASRRPRGGPSTRERIVDAAARVIRTLGLARATTKEIAREAGFSEATLYKHFRDKEDLFLHVMRERLPELVNTLKELPSRAGQGAVRDNLEEVARRAAEFYELGTPIASSLFSDPELLARHRETIGSDQAGPHLGNELLAAYLRAEQDLGRVRPEASPEAAASLLLGACYQRAFLMTFLGEDPFDQPPDRFAKDLVDTLLQGLSPGP